MNRVPYSECPLCLKPNFSICLLERDATCHPLWREGMPSSIRWLECNHCEHVYVDGYFALGDVLKILENVQDRANPDVSPPGWNNQKRREALERDRALASRVVERVRETRKKKHPGSWLDIGPGNGSLMHTANEYGWEAEGIELRGESVKKLRAQGLTVAYGDIVNAITCPQRKFDVVSMLDVLEHVPFPRVALDIVRTHLLEVGGLLVVSCPNMDTHLWREMDEVLGSNPYWHEIEHQHNFTRKSLTWLLGECGFRVTRYSISERYLSGMELHAEVVR